MGRKAAMKQKEEAGQSLVLFSLFISTAVLIVALTFDVGFALVEKRDAQNAVDAASLAIAGELRDGSTEGEALALGTTIAANHGFEFDEDDITINIPPTTGPNAGDDGYVEVFVGAATDAYFAKVIGQDFFEVGARAVAQIGEDTVLGGSPSRALFALKDSCSGDAATLIPGSSLNIIGGIHTNGTITSSGSDITATGGENTRVCSHTNSGGGNSFDPPFTITTPKPDPLAYTYASVPCTRIFTNDTDLTSVASVWQNNDKNTGILLPGVYCSTKKLSLSASDVTGTGVTLVAQQELIVSGSNFNISAGWNDVLLMTFSTSTSAMDLAGSGGNWKGFIYAPNGKAKLNGSSNLTVMGAVVAKEIEVSGSGLTIDSTQFQDLQQEVEGEPIALVE